MYERLQDFDFWYLPFMLKFKPTPLTIKRFKEKNFMGDGEFERTPSYVEINKLRCALAQSFWWTDEEEFRYFSTRFHPYLHVDFASSEHCGKVYHHTDVRFGTIKCEHKDSPLPITDPAIADSTGH